VFDNGGLKDDPVRAQQLIDSLLAGMGEGAQLPAEADSPLVRVHNTVWQRVAQVSPFCPNFDSIVSLTRLRLLLLV
jgi:hypothetical protein